MEGLDKLREAVDTLIVIPNDRLLSSCDPNLPVGEAFQARAAAALRPRWRSRPLAAQATRARARCAARPKGALRPLLPPPTGCG